MAEHVVTETISRENVRGEIRSVRQPIVRELLWTEHENRAIAQFVVLNDRERRESLSEAHTVRQDAAVVGLELIDDPGGRVTLEVKQLFPDEAVEVARSVVGQHIRRDVLQELAEDVVEHQEVDLLRR